MTRNFKRLIVALGISSLCFVGTDVWYRLGVLEDDRGQKAEVGSLVEATNEVQRKPIKRVIWENVSRDDLLFPGEAVRTTPLAEAKIRLNKTGTVIHLEPDSLVVLEENDQGLSLDFLQGNLFVQGGETQGAGTGAGKNAGTVTLKTAGGKIQLKSGDMSLSRDASGKVNLEVFNGEAELQQGNQKTALRKDKATVISEDGGAQQSEALQILSPAAGESLLLNLNRGENLEVTWKPLPAGYKVQAEIGSARHLLSSIGQPIDGTEGKMALATKPGKWFLRLSATSSASSSATTNAATENGPASPRLKSLILPLTIGNKTAPSLLEPASQASVVPRQGPLVFKWMNRHAFDQQVFEVAQDRNFKKVIVSQRLDGVIQQTQASLINGPYFWRVTGFLKHKGKSEAVPSNLHTFQVASQLQVTSISLVSPAPQARISLTEAKASGVLLKWKSQAGFTRYRIQVERVSQSAKSDKIVEAESETPQYRLADLKSGSYSWRIFGLDDENKIRGESKPQAFTVQPLPRLEWVVNEPEVTQEYTTSKSTMQLQWRASAESSQYRYRFAAQGEALDQAPWQVTKATLVEVAVPADGTYVAEIESVDSQGQALSRSETKTHLVKRKPLLPAPKWSVQAPEIWKADGKGNLSFSWQAVDGATRYLMILENESGTPVEQREITRTTASVTRLKPGQYHLKLKSVDAFKRTSEETASKRLEVPQTSDIRAPKIKTMKVK